MQQTLATALKELQLNNKTRQKMLTAYAQSIATTATTTGLVGDTNPEKILHRHILENLAIAQQIKNHKLCMDMGTGAGLPGMVLAIALPDTKWILLDSRKKCANFIKQQVKTIKPKNVTVIECRAEKYKPTEKPDLIISRALAPLPEYYRLAAPLVAKNGRILAIKGRKIEKEKAELRKRGIKHTEIEIPVPTTNDTILLVELEHNTNKTQPQ